MGTAERESLYDGIRRRHGKNLSEAIISTLSYKNLITTEPNTGTETMVWSQCRLSVKIFLNCLVQLIAELSHPLDKTDIRVKAYDFLCPEKSNDEALSEDVMARTDVVVFNAVDLLSDSQLCAIDDIITRRTPALVIRIYIKPKFLNCHARDRANTINIITTNPSTLHNYMVQPDWKRV